MNSVPPMTISVSGASPVTLRRAAAGDEAFLFRLYASVREEELSVARWEEHAKRQFLQSQYETRKRGYSQMFPEAISEIFIQDNQAIGSWILDMNEAQIHLVDVALLSEHRGKGIGTGLLNYLLTQAGALGKSVRLEALPFERALHLYARLGFVQKETAGAHLVMIWEAPGQTQLP
jgi:GNAT superfamily N-acetyltransferase